MPYEVQSRCLRPRFASIARAAYPVRMRLKILLAMLLASPPVWAQTLEKGTYVPTSGNEPTICPQEVVPVYVQGMLDGLQVIYVGDCAADDVTWYYGCQDPVDGQVICENGGIRYELRDTTHYLWTNSEYGFWAEFEKQP